MVSGKAWPNAQRLEPWGRRTTTSGSSPVGNLRLQRTRKTNSWRLEKHRRVFFQSSNGRNVLRNSHGEIRQGVFFVLFFFNQMLYSILVGSGKKATCSRNYTAFLPLKMYFHLWKNEWDIFTAYKHLWSRKSLKTLQHLLLVSSVL